MNDYRFPAPRLAFGFAAAAMTAVTIGVLVILPARMESEGSLPAATIASSRDAVGPGVAAAPESTGTASSSIGADQVARSQAGAKPDS